MRHLVIQGVLVLSLAACSDPPAPPRQVIAEVPLDQVDQWPVPPPRLDPPGGATEEQLARRARSVARLRAEGVPILETLPVIESEASCRMRSHDEIVDRLVALFAVASRGAGDPAPYVDAIVRDYGTAAHYSPLERAFMLNPRPAPEEGSVFSWRFESMAVLLWALGYRDALPSPTSPADGAELAAAVRSRTLAELRAGAVARTPAEILDRADLIYRYHWAIVDAEVAGRPAPAGLSADVVMEWHQALNWLIGYRNAAWDDVPTDT